MEAITKLLDQLKTQTDGVSVPPDYNQRRVDNINSDPGTLIGYDCPTCKNKGFVASLDDAGNIRTRQCDCQKQRKAMRLIEQSGLEKSIEAKTWDAFETPEKWQSDAKKLAQQYVTDYKEHWFAACGSVGAGKTHLCTAICGELLRKCKEVRYVMWKDDSQKLKDALNSEAYDDLITPLKDCEILYIDDLYKTKTGTPPTAGDVNLAFEIINNRYVRNKPTIISTEKDFNGLLDIDEATGSRIYEQSKGYQLRLDGKQNWRLR